MGVIMKNGIPYGGTETRTLTQAQYNALTPAEKNSGIIYLISDSDIPSENVFYDNTESGLSADNVQDAIDELEENSGGSSYSTEERIIGTWIDGKPLYEKTYSYTIDDLDAGTMTTSRISGYFDIDQDFDLIWLESGFFYNPQAGSGTDVLSCNINYPQGGNFVRSNIQKLSASSNARIYFDDTYAASSFYEVRDTLKFFFTLRYTKPST